MLAAYPQVKCHNHVTIDPVVSARRLRLEREAANVIYTMSGAFMSAIFISSRCVPIIGFFFSISHVLYPSRCRNP